MKAKRNLFVSLVILTLLLCCSMLFVACNDEGGTGGSNPTYTVAFKVDGRNYDIVLVEEGKTVTLPAAPEKDGYTFDGWYADEACLQGYTASAVSQSIDVYAKFTANVYTITYEADGGTNPNTASTFTVADKVTLADAQKSGFTFDGWYLNGERVSSVPKGTTGNVTLTAKYTAVAPDTYRVTFLVGGKNYDVQLVKDGSLAALPTNPEKDGYIFGGWFTDGDCTQAFDATSAVTADTKVYAKMTANTYTLTYNANGGTNPNTASTFTVEDKIVLADAQKAGYLFKGWKNGDEYMTSIPKGTAESITLTAVFEKDGYVITYENVDDAYCKNPKAYAVDDETFELNPAYKDGYRFEGWYTTEEFTGEQVTEIPQGSAGNLTLYAKFTLIEANIVYLNTKDVQHGYASKYSVEQPVYVADLEKAGYTFLGWFDEYDNKVTVVDFDGFWGENVTLTAKWQLNTYTITYEDLRGADNTDNKTTFTVEDGTITFADLADRGGFTFAGWSFMNGTPVTSYTFNVSERDDDIVLTAKWNAPDSALAAFTYVVDDQNRITITGVNDTAVTELTVPDYVYSIDLGAFKDCTNLQKLTVPYVGNRSNGEYHSVGYIFGAKTFLQNEIIPSSLKKITVTGGYSNNETLKTYAFYNCLHLTDIVIGNGVTNIEQSVFYDCVSLESITLPFIGDQKDGLSAYRYYTFGYVFGTSTKFTDLMYNGYFYASNSSGGKSAYIPNSLTTVTVNGGEIFASGFQGCSSVEKIVLGDGIEKIGHLAFEGCTNLEEIIIPSSIKTIDTLAFWNTKYEEKLNTEVQDADGFIYINDILYQYNGEAATIYIKEGTRAIAASAFENNKYIKTVICPSSLRYIGSETSTIGAFYGCSNLTKIELNEGLEVIGSKTFRKCTSLDFTDFPSTITFIGKDAFYETTYLSNLSDGEHYIGKVFYKYIGEMPENTTITIKEGTVGIGYGAFSKTVVSSSSNDGFANLVEVIMPDSVTWIGDAAFRCATNLKNIKLSKNLTQIGEQAFYNCSSLSDITLPKSLKLLNSRTFDGCNLDLIFEENSSLEAIFSSALSGLSAESFVYLPESVKYIEKNGLSTDATVMLPIINAEIDSEAYGGTIFFKGSKSDSYQLDNIGGNFYCYSEYEPDISASGSYSNYWHYDLDGTPVIWGNENKTYFTVIEGTQSVWSYCNAQNLFDGSNNTEWQIGSSVYNAEDGAYFIVEASQEITIRGYNITVKRYEGQGWPSYESNFWPKSWVIYGSNDLENWSEIKTVEDSGIYNPIVGYGYTYYQDMYFSISGNETAYKYYKVAFHSYDDLNLQIIQFKFEYPKV